MKTTHNLKMHISLTAMLLIMALSTQAQFTWEHAHSYGSNQQDFGKCLATDMINSVYVAGEYEEVLLDENNMQMTPALPLGCNDIFLMRYDENGNLMMSKSMGNPWYGYNSPYSSHRWVNGMASAEPDGLYITGCFSKGICVLDPLTANNSDDGNDFFIARIEPNSGHCIWVRTAGQNPSPFSYDAYGTAVAADNMGNVYVLGNFSNNLVFDNMAGMPQVISSSLNQTPNQVTLNAINQDIFLVKYNLMGDCLWVRHIKGNTGSYFNYGNAVRIDQNGDVYVTGSFQTSITLGNITLISTGANDIFLAKYGQHGNCLWAINEGGHCHNAGLDIAIGQNNNVFVTGYFQGTPRFGGWKLLTSAGAADIFLAKYDPQGQCLNAKRFGNIQDDIGVRVKIREDRLWLMGYYSDHMQIGPVHLISSNPPEYFLAEFQMPVLQVLEAENLVNSKTGALTGADLALNPHGDVYVTGNYNGSGSFVPHTLPPSANFSSDVFFSKIAFWNTKNAVAETPAATSDTTFSFTVYPNPAVESVSINFLHEAKLPAELEVSDATGRKVLSLQLPEGLNGAVINRRQLGGPGLYLFSVTINGVPAGIRKIVFTD